MSDPRRLLAGGSPSEAPDSSNVTDFERGLLRAWSSRQPSPDARARALAAVGAATLGVAGLGAASGHAAAGVGGSVAPKAMLLSSALVKWLAVGVGAMAGAVASLAVVAYVRHGTPEPSRAEGTPAVAATIPAPHGTPSPSPAVQDLGDLPANPLANADRTAPGTHSTSASRNETAPRSTLDDEVTVVDQARRSLAGGDPVAAIALLDAYDAKYPGGTLTQESTALRIEAFLRQGNRAAAEHLANRFLATHAASPYAHRIRALLAGAPSER